MLKFVVIFLFFSPICLAKTDSFPNELFGIKIGSKPAEYENKKIYDYVYKVVPLKKNEMLEEYSVWIDENGEIWTIKGETNSDCLNRYYSLREFLNKKYGIESETGSENQGSLNVVFFPKKNAMMPFNILQIFYYKENYGSNKEPCRTSVQMVSPVNKIQKNSGKGL